MYPRSIVQSNLEALLSKKTFFSYSIINMHLIYHRFGIHFNKNTHMSCRVSFTIYHTFTIPLNKNMFWTDTYLSCCINCLSIWNTLLPCYKQHAPVVLWVDCCLQWVKVAELFFKLVLWCCSQHAHNVLYIHCLFKHKVLLNQHASLVSY